MDILKIAAFSDGDTGGNPAGVSLSERLPPETEMRRIAADVGFSETAFAAPLTGDADAAWRVRYFSPESEVPFCGHATIALGAALARRDGNGIFALALNEASISVEGRAEGERLSAALQSPPTRSEALDADTLAAVLALFGLSASALDPSLPPALAFAGASHVIVALESREALASMDYDLDAGRELMSACGLVTIALLHAETSRRFHVRNAFASGGVHEDPATGAAAAALGGYLRDLRWPHGGALDIVQGEDMGARSLLHVEITDAPGSSVRVSGAARLMRGE